MNQKTRFLLSGMILMALVTGFCTADIPACPFEDFSILPAIPDPFDYTGIGGVADPFPAVDPDAVQVPCPFEDTAGGGVPDPFPAVDPDAVQVPCPFEDTAGGGVPDPFPAVDPDAVQVPCPFPVSGAAAVSSTGIDASACSAEECPPPADLDGDGTYEDLNGNGRTDFSDVILFFKNMDWIKENQPVSCFDYNTNGNIDFSDVILLFRKV